VKGVIIRIYFRFLVLLVATVTLGSANTVTETTFKKRLLEMATLRFGTHNTLAEQQLFELAVDGEEIDCTALPEGFKVIRSDRLRWLLTNPEVSPMVSYRGISIVGATIHGPLDLSWAKIPFRLSMRQCVLDDTLRLLCSHISSLYLLKSVIKDLHAEGLVVEGDIYLREDFKSQGEVSLKNAHVGGILDCNKSEFNSGSDRSLDLDGAEIKGSVYLTAIKSLGTVVITDAKIGGMLNCINGKFDSHGQSAALDLHGIRTDGTVYLADGFAAQGTVSLVDANIGGTLDCKDGNFAGGNNLPALSARGAKIEGPVILAGDFKARGGVSLSGATIGQFLKCQSGQFTSSTKILALNLSNTAIRGYVALSSDFETQKMFRAEGGVSLDGAAISEDLDCSGGYYIAKGDVPAFSANGAKIEGSVYFRQKVTTEGKVSFSHAFIGHNLEWRDVNRPENTSLDLRFTKAGAIYSDPKSWPLRGNLAIDGFDYDRIERESYRDATTELDWVHRQNPDRFFSQPYERLATVLKNMGFEEDQKQVIIAKNKDQAGHVSPTPDQMKDWLWFNIFGPLIGYGYRPMRALWISLIIIGIGSLLFRVGFDGEVVTPSDEKAYANRDNVKPPISELYPKFNAFVYSLETFVPFLKLGVREFWRPNANRTGSFRLGPKEFPISGTFLRVYLWLHIIAGWILTTLWVGGLSGLVKS
jgi:hypothetical protein